MVRKKANNLFEIGLFRVLWKFDLGAHQGGNLTGDRRKKERKTKEREMGGWESVLSGGAAFLSPPVDGAWNYVSCLFLFFLCVSLITKCSTTTEKEEGKQHHSTEKRRRQQHARGATSTTPTTDEVNSAPPERKGRRRPKGSGGEG